MHCATTSGLPVSCIVSGVWVAMTPAASTPRPAIGTTLEAVPTAAEPALAAAVYAGTRAAGSGMAPSLAPTQVRRAPADIDWMSAQTCAPEAPELETEAERIVRDLPIPPCPGILAGFATEMARPEPDLRKLAAMVGK